MQSADPIGESPDGQVGAQTSNRLSVPRSRTRLSFVKMRILPWCRLRRSLDRFHTTNARWPTPWRVVFCKKMKNQVRNGGGMSVPPGLQLIKEWRLSAWCGMAKMAIVNPQAACARA
jgi:hypothetical protein